MVGNPDLLRALPKEFEPESDDFFNALCEQVENYGGFAVQVSPGSYTVYRKYF
jgi:hypothetical protein